jgi:WD40 repeat protein
MSYHLLTVASIKMGISLSLGAMIVLVKFGILILEICYIHSKVIKMQSILWLLMCLMGKKSFISRDRIATGSFDKTAKLWDTQTGQCLSTFAGHQN